MNIQHLELVAFRNYEHFSFDFESNCIHCLFGKNAQGKTNLIESIYYLSHLRSFRTHQLNSLVNDSKDFMMMEANVESNHRHEKIRVVVSNQQKHLYYFQNPVKKYSDFVGIVNAILFCPDDMMIFNQSPKYRRRFIDMELIKLSKKYTYTLSHYQKLLHQRNQALKQDVINEVLIQTYTEQMIQDEEVIIRQRNEFIHEWIQKAQELYPFFKNQEEKMDASYETFVKLEEDIPSQLKEIYEHSYEKDVRYRQTNMGIHKDDIVFLLNDIPLQEGASQGQKRCYLLVMKLALAQIIKEKTGQYPILLLDDVFSELDAYRKNQFVRNLPKDMQIFITTAEPVDPNWFENRNVHYYEINHGSIKEVHE